MVPLLTTEGSRDPGCNFLSPPKPLSIQSKSKLQTTSRRLGRVKRGGVSSTSNVFGESFLSSGLSFAVREKKMDRVCATPAPNPPQTARMPRNCGTRDHHLYVTFEKKRPATWIVWSSSCVPGHPSGQLRGLIRGPIRQLKRIVPATAQLHTGMTKLQCATAPRAAARDAMLSTPSSHWSRRPCSTRAAEAHP